MSRALLTPLPSQPAADRSGAPFERRLPLPARLPHWRDPDLPSLAEMLRRYGREGTVLSALPHQPELLRIDLRPLALSALLADTALESTADDRPSRPAPLSEPFSEPLEGLHTREIHDETVFSTLFGDLR